jgi:L-alanine-DL-glutamate epimerase-like enolase superfamily enzyme
MEITGVETIRFESVSYTTSDEKGHSHPAEEPIETTSTITRIEVDGGPDGIARGGSESQARHAEEFIVGASPFERERLWEDLYRTQRLGRMTTSGLRYIDLALWDAMGKATDQPVYKLAGGYRDSVPTYASTMVGDDDPDGLGTVEAYVDFAEDLVDQGYPAIKFHSWMPPYDASPERVIEMCRAVREAVDPEIDLMLDSHHYYDRTEAKKIGDALAEIGFTWFEEPMDEYSMSSYEWLTDEVDVPIVGPETAEGKMYTRAEWLKRGVADISRTGVGDVGGLTPALRTSHVAESFNVTCEVHGGGMGNLHLVGATPGGDYLEWGLLHPKAEGPTGHADWFDLPQPDENGVVHIPDRPGLGHDIDWDYVEENRID